MIVDLIKKFIKVHLKDLLSVLCPCLNFALLMFEVCLLNPDVNSQPVNILMPYFALTYYLFSLNRQFFCDKHSRHLSSILICWVFFFCGVLVYEIVWMRFLSVPWMTTLLFPLLAVSQLKQPNSSKLFSF